MHTTAPSINLFTKQFDIEIEFLLDHSIFFSTQFNLMCFHHNDKDFWLDYRFFYYNFFCLRFN